MTSLTLRSIIVIATVLIIQASCAFSQVCSCGGVPLIGSLSIPDTQKGQIILKASFESKSINQLYSGRERLGGATRSQTVQSSILEGTIGLSDRFLLSLTLSGVNQVRRTKIAALPSNKLRTAGIGDAVVLLIWNVSKRTENRLEFQLGAGLKAPLGQSDLRDNGILIAGDMQPGSGAWDGIIWGRASFTGSKSQTMKSALTLSHNFRGKNDHFSDNGETYQFGAETQIMVDLFSRSILGVIPSMGLIFIDLAASDFGGSRLTNSGGTWINIKAGVASSFTSNWGLALSGERPMYQDVNGTQLTKSWSALISLIYSS